METRIFKILEYIHHPIIPQLRTNLGFFSEKELSQILEYLETGSLNPIAQLLSDKIKEYKTLLQSIKLKKSFHGLKNHKILEHNERKKEKEEIENMIDFD